MRHRGSSIRHHFFLRKNDAESGLALLAYLVFTANSAGTIITRMLLVYAVMAFIILLLMPSEAFAWGPGMHVEVALNAIEKSAVIAPVIAELIKRFPEAFIYGAASPDIIVGKKYAGYLHHCHNWRMGHLILSEAKTDRQRAAAYGYLMHLASDIVAHNYYIPVKIVRSWKRRLLTHTYWEMRFDLGVRDEVWERLNSITEHDIEEFDELLEQVLRKTLFSFSTNKTIFNTILMIQKMHSLRASLRFYAKRSRFDIGEENRQHYVDLAMEASLDFLKLPKNAPCLQVDPAGLSRLNYAKNIRRSMRDMMKRSLMTEKQADKFVELVKERLALGLYRPDMQLPIVMDVL